MITVTAAYRKLRSKLPGSLDIVDGFEIKDAYIFAIADESGEGNGGYPFFSVLKTNGTISGYNPMQNIPEYLNAIKNNAIDVDSLR